MAAPEEHANILQQELARLALEREELAKTRTALQQEFAQASSHSDIVAKARNAIRDLMPDAIMQMAHLLKHAESESVRASLSKFIVSTGLDSSKFQDESSTELKKLLEGFTTQTPVP